MSEIASQKPTVAAELPRVQTAGCPRCGSPVEPEDRFCGACGSEQPVAAELVAQPAQRYLRCKNCGAEIGVDPGQRSYLCPFCESTYVVEFTPEQSGRQAPEFVIGFALTPEQALEQFRRWIGQGGWFRPADLRTARVEDKLRGVYVPFWSFSMLAESHWSAQIGEYWYRTETYTTRKNGKTVTRTRQVRETEWWPLRGRHHHYYSGYLVSGSRGLPQREADQLKPFHLAALKRYQPYFLAGWMCEEYSLPREEALRICQAEFYRREQERVARFLPGDTHSDLQVATQFSRVSSDLILLPIYMLSYRYGQRRFRFLVNGQTGKVYGEKPVSWPRIAVALLVAVSAVLIVARAGGGWPTGRTCSPLRARQVLCRQRVGRAIESRGAGLARCHCPLGQQCSL